MAVAFNGTTVTATGLIAAIKSVRYQGSCAPVQVTGSDAGTKLFRPGIPSETLTVEVVGSSTATKGASGAVTVAWSDGGADGSMTLGCVMKTPGMSGSMDAENRSTITYKNTTA